MSRTQPHVILGTQRRFVYRARGSDLAGLFTKDPSERYPVSIDMRQSVPVGTTLTGATLSAIDIADNSDATATGTYILTPPVAGSLGLWARARWTVATAAKFSIGFVFSGG